MFQSLSYALNLELAALSYGTERHLPAVSHVSSQKRLTGFLPMLCSERGL
jgi:hypothetical protein